MKLYSPYQIERMTNKEIRSEYSKLRSVANKRLRRLWLAGLGSYGLFTFPIIKGRSDQQIATWLAAVSRFLRDKRTTIKGEREFVNNELEMLHDMGYKFITRENFYDFTKFMDSMRDQVGGKIFDSGDAADVFNEGQRLKIPADVLKMNFDYFAENLSAMEKIEPIKTEKTIKFSDIKRKMKRFL